MTKMRKKIFVVIFEEIIVVLEMSKYFFLFIRKCDQQEGSDVEFNDSGVENWLVTLKLRKKIPEWWSTPTFHDPHKSSPRRDGEEFSTS